MGRGGGRGLRERGSRGKYVEKRVLLMECENAAKKENGAYGFNESFDS